MKGSTQRKLIASFYLVLAAAVGFSLGFYVAASYAAALVREAAR